MPAIITEAQFENRLGREVVARIYDDNNDGVADANPVIQLLEDASSKVRGAIGPVFDSLQLTAANSSDASELRRITLDVAVAMAAQRHSGYVRYNWRDLMEQADKDLKMLRTGMSNLGGTLQPPEAASNQGGYSSADELSVDESPRKFDFFGSF